MFNDCASYGVGKAIDGKTSSFSGMTITGFTIDSANPLNSYMQFDLGSVRSDITAVRMIGPISSTYSTLPENVSVYLSATPDFKAGTLCETGVSFTEPSQPALVECPAAVPAKYLTVFYNVANQRLALMEVTPYYEGGSTCDLCWARPRPACHYEHGRCKHTPCFGLHLLRTLNCQLHSLG